jgi:5-methylcytosine-specific restriction protein A
VALRRACLDCGKLGRWRHRCPRCEALRERAKVAARPDRKTYAETRRRREAVAAHRATVGDWCPGVPELGRPAHPAANLSADHAVEVAAGGPESGPLVVRCVPCNSARSANVRRPLMAVAATTPAQPNARLHSAATAGRSESGARSCPGPSAPPGYCLGDCPGCPQAAMDAMGRSRGHPTPLDDGPVVA